MNKVCSKCGVDKDLSEYNKHSGCKFGVRSDCKVCQKKVSITYRNRTKEERSEKGKLLRKQKADIRTNEHVIYLKDKYVGIEFGSFVINKYVGNFKKANAKYSRYYFEKECKFCGEKTELNAGQIDAFIKSKPICKLCNESVNIHTHMKKCADCQTWKPATIEYFPQSKNRRFGIHYYCFVCHTIRSKERRLDPKNREKECIQKKQRLKEDSFFRFKCRIRSLVANGIKSRGYKKTSKTQKILGASFDVVKIHLEKQFIEGMSWDNHGEWHIDHKIPLASGKTEDDVIKLSHYKNLQPLWAFDNISKGAKLNWTKT